MRSNTGLLCLVVVSGIAMAGGGPRPGTPRAWTPTLVGDERAASAIRSGAARPVALAAADFDGDLRVDVVAAYANGTRGALVLHRANGAAPGGPFLGEAQVFALDFAPDFVAAGDVDNDARADVLAASRGQRSVTILPGDGQGALEEPREIALPGALTAFAAGDINAMDGVVDLAVAVTSGSRSTLVILESPIGIAEAAGEELALPAPAAALGIGNANGDSFDDIVVAAGRELLVVAGRDRRLGETAAAQIHVGPLAATRRTLEFEPQQVRLGAFRGAEVDDIVLIDAAGGVSTTTAARRTPPEPLALGEPASTILPARMFAGPAEEMVVLEPGRPRLRVRSHGGEVAAALRSAPVAALAVRLDHDAIEDLVLLEDGGRGALTTSLFAPAAVLLVANTADAGAGSLRDAINAANILAGPDVIQFNIPGAGPHTISPTSALPTIVDTLTIDATTQPGFAGSPLISISGASAGFVNGLVFDGPASGTSAVLGLNVRDFNGTAIQLNGSSDNVIAGCTIGTDPAGAGPAPNRLGVGVYGAQNTLIGGVPGNVISGNTDTGVLLQGGGPVSSAYPSTDVPRPIPDLTNIVSTLTVTDETLIEDLDVTIDITHTFDGDLQITLVHPDGTPVPLALNRGGGGDNFSSTIFDDEAATPISAGTAPFAGSFRPESPLSAFDGKPGTGVWRLEIGDVFGGDSGTLHSWSIRFQHRTTSNQILNNKIGTDAAGAVAVGNGVGIGIRDEQMDRIGRPGQGNVISANVLSGIVVDGAFAYGNHFESNLIGTDATGTIDLGNVPSGVRLTFGARGNTVGGAAAGTGNVVSGHDSYGIELIVGRENRILGNLIGTDATGTVAIPNTYGIHVNHGSTDNTIGGTTPGAGNVISGNTSNGVFIDVSGSNRNVLLRNRIGTDLTGAFAVPNGSEGIVVYGDETAIGDAAGNGNLVSGNVASGMFFAGRANQVVGNIVGLDATMSAPVPNGGSGVFINGRSNVIGDGAAPANVIAGNGADGVRIIACCTSSQTFSSVDTPKPLPDLVTTTSTIAVSAIAYVVELEVSLSLTHTFDGDLRITLIDPAGRRILLSDRRGGGGDDYANTTFDDGAATPIAAGLPPFSGSYIPERPLSISDGVHANGNWTLEIADLAGADFGTLLSWSVMLRLVDSLGNTIDHNFIGTNGAGDAGLGNSGAGVHLIDAAGTVIGSFGNVIAGNRWGVLVEGGLSAGTFVHENLIGSVGDPATNLLDGIVLDGAVGTLVFSNTIAGNGGNGIVVRSGYNNTMRLNELGGNGRLGIDLEPGPGVTPNDASDTDGGANGLQNFPVLVGKTPVGPSTQIDGVLRSTPLTDFLIDLYDNSAADLSGHGEGEAWRASVLVTTDITGNAPFSLLVSGTVAFPTTTATGPGGNTSEFSGAFAWPQEVPDTITVSQVGALLEVDYAPACGAANHAVFWGQSPILGTLTWTNGTCPIGTSGTFQFDPGEPPPGTFMYFVVVGQTAGLEGSYGQDSVFAERPEATLVGICDQPLSIGGVCP